jgi:hypothetical protein
MKAVDWEPSCCRRKDGRTDRQTDMTKLVAAFRSFAKAPKNSLCGQNVEFLTLKPVVYKVTYMRYKECKITVLC